MAELILYTTEDGKSQIKLRADRQTVWLTQLEMAELFDASKQNIFLHLKNLFEVGELDPAATVKESLVVPQTFWELPRSSLFPRRRESRPAPQWRAKDWIPAFAGMTGFVRAGAASVGEASA